MPTSFAVRILCSLSCLFCITVVYAQETKENVFLHPDKFYKKFFPHMKITDKPADSNYVKTYPNNLTVAIHLLAPKIYADLAPLGPDNRDGHAVSQLRTNVNTIVGFSFSYRHVTAGFATSALLPPFGDAPGYVSSRYRTATIKYKTPAYILGFRFMKVSGLTDVNTLNNVYDPTQYSARPDITIKEYQFDGIYNFSWKKYSYLSTLDLTQRQVKSHMGFMLKAGVYNQQLFCDSNLLSVPQRPYFKQFENISKMIGYSIKLAPGMGVNLVFKRRFYFSVAIFSPLNLYINKLYTADDHLSRTETTLQWVLDGAASIGYQSRHFYAALRCELDGRKATLEYVSYTSTYNYLGLDIGYRFTAPKFMKTFYKKTMPPGM